MLEVEKGNIANNLENKRHYVINDKHTKIVFNDRIIKRYKYYYNDSTNIKYNLPHTHK